ALRRRAADLRRRRPDRRGRLPSRRRGRRLRRAGRPARRQRRALRAAGRGRRTGVDRGLGGAAARGPGVTEPLETAAAREAGAGPWGTLDLAPIGNCNVNALVDRAGRFVWGCAPRPDGDPVFSALLAGRDPADAAAQGLWEISLAGGRAVEQDYIRNTAVLRT